MDAMATLDGGVDGAAACATLPNGCAAAGAGCDGDTVVTCAPNADGCLVETRTECADGAPCDDTATPTCPGDPCFGVSTCAVEGVGCDGDTLQTCTPNAQGCLIASETDCGAVGNRCDAGTAACVGASGPSCGPARVLNCESGFFDSTEAGTQEFDQYCGAIGYEGAERIYAFAAEDVHRVSVLARGMEASVDLDLFAFVPTDPAACEIDGCIAESRAHASFESVAFDYAPGDVVYIAVDVYDDEVGVSDFRIDITCEETRCGDGVLQDTEECDDGNGDAGDGCGASCRIEPGHACNTDERPTPCIRTCGDGEISGDETCDDGNFDGGDGCSDRCEIEPGFACETNAAGLSVCTGSCGEGVVNGDDECDDGGAASGDGCSSSCEIEAGFVCVENDDERSTCRTSCGDWLLNGDDECDDGNLTGGDGCSPACQIEDGYVCRGDDRRVRCQPGISIDGRLENSDSPWTRPTGRCEDRVRTAGF
ncbi:MAG: DUF4215 domain-containing protein, partial [Myxococcota bacterium]